MISVDCYSALTDRAVRVFQLWLLCRSITIKRKRNRVEQKRKMIYIKCFQEDTGN